MEQQNNAAKFAFYYMLSLVALIFTAVSAGMIIFQIINKEIIDILNRYNGGFSYGPLKFAISAIFISAPIFYLVMWQIHKNLYSGVLAKDSGVRKWLTYFILFVSSVTMLGWLVATVNNFLNGELTLKFILKSLSSIIIAAAIFVFYYHEIKREIVAGSKDKFIKIYFYASLAFVSAVFISSLFYVESPTQTRNRLLDNAILSNFSSLDSAIQSFYQNKGALPKTLDELKTDYSYITDRELTDPATNQKLEYIIVDKKNYELCATFRTTNKITDNGTNLYEDYQGIWPHDTGYQCLKKIVQDLNNGIKPVPAR